MTANKLCRCQRFRDYARNFVPSTLRRSPERTTDTGTAPSTRCAVRIELTLEHIHTEGESRRLSTRSPRRLHSSLCSRTACAERRMLRRIPECDMLEY